MEENSLTREIEERDLMSVAKLLDSVVGHSDYADIARMGGLTNRTYSVAFPNGEKYVVRIPGEGTEELIVRDDEKVSTELACSLDIDAKLLHFGDDGSKVTEFIPDALTMSAELFHDDHRIEQAAAIMRRLHDCGKDTGVPFEVFDMAAGYEKIIFDNNVPMYDDYDEVKAVVMAIKDELDSVCDIKKVPCHNDVLCENWVVSGGDRMYLIDWEYAGMNDALWDVADLSIEAAFSEKEDMKLLRAYLGREPEAADLKRFFANKLYVDYLWTLWAKTRVPYDGKPMEDWAAERYARLKSNIEQYRKI